MSGEWWGGGLASSPTHRLRLHELTGIKPQRERESAHGRETIVVRYAHISGGDAVSVRWRMGVVDGDGVVSAVV